MHNANPDSAQTEDSVALDAPEMSQWPAIILTGIVLGFWVLWSVNAEHFVGPVVSLFEWFEQVWALDILPGRKS
jgi:hypothetical protein